MTGMEKRGFVHPKRDVLRGCLQHAPSVNRNISLAKSIVKVACASGHCAVIVRHWHCRDLLAGYRGPGHEPLARWVGAAGQRAAVGAARVDFALRVCPTWLILMVIWALAVQRELPRGSSTFQVAGGTWGYHVCMDTAHHFLGRMFLVQCRVVSKHGKG